MRSVSVLIVLLASAVPAADSRTDSPVFVIDLNQTRLLLRGVISSAGHEQILRQTAARQFPDAKTEIDLHIGSALPSAWSLITDQTLRALAHTQSATATITPAGIILHGVTSSPTAWFAALTRLEILLAPDIAVESTINPFSNGQSFNSLCRQLFTAAFRNHKIEFAERAKTLSSSAYGLLDELAELGTDCPSASIRITGNGDGGSANQQNGKQRADAVAAYLTGRGFDPSRLQAIGAVISTNRRIVFAISFAEQG